MLRNNDLSEKLSVSRKTVSKVVRKLKEENRIEIELYAKDKKITLDEALDFFYNSETYRLMREGVSDMHCMSDEYLVEEIKEERIQYQ